MTGRWREAPTRSTSSYDFARPAKIIEHAGESLVPDCKFLSQVRNRHRFSGGCQLLEDPVAQLVLGCASGDHAETRLALVFAYFELHPHRLGRGCGAMLEAQLQPAIGVHSSQIQIGVTEGVQVG